jgi:hypothetical protein
MLTHISRRLSFANVASALALFVALSTGTAYAAGYVVSSNSQVAPSTISGHGAPAGDHPNIIAGSVTAADLAAPAAWHAVAPNPMAAGDPCFEGVTGYFCGSCPSGSCEGIWGNSGGSFAPAAFAMDLQGTVHLRGLVSVSAGADFIFPKIFDLPQGYRPAHELVFTTLDNDNNGSYLVRVDVRADGFVIVVNDEGVNGTCSCGQFLSLDGISFRTGE